MAGMTTQLAHGIRSGPRTAAPLSCTRRRARSCHLRPPDAAVGIVHGALRRRALNPRCANSKTRRGRLSPPPPDPQDFRPRLLLCSTAERTRPNLARYVRRGCQPAPSPADEGAYLSTCHLPWRTFGFTWLYMPSPPFGESRGTIRFPHKDYSTSHHNGQLSAPLFFHSLTFDHGGCSTRATACYNLGGIATDGVEAPWDDRDSCWWQRYC